jgi:hypothetical protein
MSSNRLKVLLVSLLAVFAASAVASASASASATCFKVVTAGTGNKDSSCVTDMGATANEYITIEKLATQLKAQKSPALGEWCAEVAAGTGIYKDNLCSSAVAPKNFIKVFVHEYEVCQEVPGEGKEPPTKFDDHTCSTALKEVKLRKWEWKFIAVGTNFPVESTGGEFKLTNGVKESVCTGVTNTGEIRPGGESDEVFLKFTGCTNGPKTCEAFSPGKDGTKEIEVKDIDAQLVERLTNGGGGPVLADEFKEGDSPANEFVTIEFEATGTEACTGFTTIKVKGQVAGECKNVTVGGVGQTELNFPNPELQGNNLTAFGGASSLFGKANAFISGADVGWSVRCL